MKPTVFFVASSNFTTIDNLRAFKLNGEPVAMLSVLADLNAEDPDYPMDIPELTYVCMDVAAWEQQWGKPIAGETIDILCLGCHVREKGSNALRYYPPIDKEERS